MTARIHQLKAEQQSDNPKAAALVFSYTQAAQTESNCRIYALDSLKAHGGKIQAKPTMVAEYLAAFARTPTEFAVHVSDLDWGDPCDTERFQWSIGSETEVVGIVADWIGTVKSQSCKKLDVMQLSAPLQTSRKIRLSSDNIPHYEAHFGPKCGMYRGCKEEDQQGTVRLGDRYRAICADV
jgi:hypothetical protein